MEDLCRIILSWSSRFGTANDRSIGSLGASTDDGRGLSMERLQAVESQMRLVFSAVLGRLDESVSLPTQASHNRSQPALPVSNVSTTSDVSSPVQKPANYPASAPAHDASSKGIADLPGKLRVWTAEEVDHWLQARPPAEGVALWLSGKAGLEGLAEACSVRGVDGLGLLALLRPDELPPVAAAVTGPLTGLQSDKRIDGADVDLKVRAK